MKTVYRRLVPGATLGLAIRWSPILPKSAVAIALAALTLVGVAATQPAALGALPPAESLGPSSRRTALVISEIMYAPAPRLDGRDLEFIELYNPQPWFYDLGGYRLTGAIEFTFPPGTQLPYN